MKAKFLGGAAAAALWAAMPAAAQTAPPATPSPQPAAGAQTTQGNQAVEAQPVPAPAAASPAAGPSESAMVNLVRALVAQGTLTPERGQALIQQAEAEAAQARAAASATAVQSARVAANTQRIPYVPDVVRQQIKDELRTEVLATAEAQNWAKPGQVPEWSQRIKIGGDFRFRVQYNFYSDSNNNQITDFFTFNQLGPIDINPAFNPRPGDAATPRTPLLNTRVDDLHQIQYRARLSLDAQVTDTVKVGIRLASGNDRSPVTTTQLAGGGFTKKDFWLDRAFVTWKPAEQFSLTAGRLPNPFYGLPGPQSGDRNTQILWDEDVNFDGLAVDANTGEWLGRNFTLGAQAGVFAFQYGQENFPTFSQTKITPRNKWIYGGELTANWQARKDLGVLLAAAFYKFDGVQAQPSAPCQLFGGNVECSTDTDVPAWLQKGNTLYFIRNIVPDPRNPNNFSQPQFAGLSFNYGILDLSGDIRLALGGNNFLIVGGDYIKNLDFRRADLCKTFASVGAGLPATRRGPVNNTDAVGGNADVCNAAVLNGPLGRFVGGDTAWEVRATLGAQRVRKAGDFQIFAAYRNVESDAVLDSLNDSDFHLGGTNAKGYILSGQYGLLDNTSIRARWFSTNQISGPKYAIDSL
ncbi:MAG: putative porin [Sphingomonadaceae bacterium]|nr:putative porin [Sphingomonadaceae bacterium]